MSVVAQPLFRTGGGRFPAILKAARWHHRRASPTSGIRAPRYPLREFTPCAPGRSIQQNFQVTSIAGLKIQFFRCGVRYQEVNPIHHRLHGLNG